MNPFSLPRIPGLFLFHGKQQNALSRFLGLAIILLTCALPTAADEVRDRNIAETMLLYQRATGGWPKNYDETHRPTEVESRKILSERNHPDSTFDNGATHSEMRHLAKVYRQTGDERYKQAFLRGLEFVLGAQYANGGWPQYHPDTSGYFVHVTFNDDAMIGVMRLLRDIGRSGPDFSFVASNDRERCRAAVDKGVQCILKCQILVAGHKTAWCAQHDSRTLAPAKARSYELPSLSGSESVGITRFLMEIEPPTPEIIAAVQGAIAWFDEAKLTGIKVIRKPDPSSPKGWDKVVIQDPSAPPLWARFYRIGDNQPIFCSRDGVPKRTLAEISYERRNGYSWLGNRPASLLSRDYPVWQSKWAPDFNVLERGRIRN
ncbi:MAG: pectate lyase [Verrucomicrobia bacterium]|nr:pectate lyase [Verrucomicrobiota bacterium]